MNTNRSLSTLEAVAGVSGCSANHPYCFPSSCRQAPGRWGLMKTDDGLRGLGQRPG